MKQILMEALDYWESLSEFRKTRSRCIDYVFGRQWNDPVTVDGHTITEEQYLLSEGNIPLKNNLMRRIVRNILGVFRKRLCERKPPEGSLADIASKNRLEELYSRTMEEFLISGLAVFYKWFGLRDGQFGIWTDPVHIPSFFFNTEATDPRGHDITLIGRIHSVDMRSWCAEFVRTPHEYEKARILFGNSLRSRRKIVEIWRREQRPRRLIHDRKNGCLLKIEDNPAINFTSPSKWFLDDVWRYYFISEEGICLRQGDSPYMHGSHPFVMKAYPLLDGEIHSLASDMIDQQKYTNRLISIYDWLIRASAKGVLLIPEGSVSAKEMEFVAREWSRFDGVIPYRPLASGQEPHQVSANATNPAISELLEIQLKMFEDVSGVTGTLSGNLSSTSVSGTLYSQQTENSLYSLSDILESFDAFIDDSTRKDLSLLQQCGK